MKEPTTDAHAAHIRALAMEIGSVPNFKKLSRDGEHGLKAIQATLVRRYRRELNLSRDDIDLLVVPNQHLEPAHLNKDDIREAVGLILNKTVRPPKHASDVANIARWAGAKNLVKRMGDEDAPHAKKALKIEKAAERKLPQSYREKLRNRSKASEQDPTR